MSTLPNMDNNKAYVLRDRSSANIEQWPAPKAPGPNELLLKTLAVGICGSDVHYYKGMQCGPFIVKDPMVLGHETSARVVSVGPGVKGFQPGDLVVTEPAVPCRTCSYCRNNQYNLCPEIACHATPPYHGSLTNYFLHAADYCFKVPKNVSGEEAAMIEPLAVAVHAVTRSKVTVGNRVLVTGAGPIGLLCVMVAKVYGASQVVVTDISEERLKLAEKIGAYKTILSTRETSEESMVNLVRSSFDGDLPNVTLECSGAPSCTRLALLATQNGGVVVLVGLGPMEMTLPITEAASREITILGSFRYKNCFPTAVALVASGKLQLKELISHRFSFEDSTKAYELAGTGNAVKIVIKFDDE